MTPLLWRIIKEYARPLRDRVVSAEVLEELRTPLVGVHSYEITAIWDSCARIVHQGYSPNGIFTFAPGDKVWLEALVHDKHTQGRIAFLIAGASVWRLTCTDIEGKSNLEKQDSLFEPQMSGISAYAEKQASPINSDTGGPSTVSHFRFIRAAFSIINRPQHIGLRVHQPHKGRLKQLNGTGFPLRVWHEVVVGRPTRDHQGQQIDSLVSGKKPFHHVRAHYKPSLGVVIPEHWRGDPSIGIKRTRYRVDP